MAEQVPMHAEPQRQPKRRRLPAFIASPLHATRRSLRAVKSPQNPVPQPRHLPSRQVRPAMLSSQSGGADEDEENEPSEEMNVYRDGKRRPHSGDLLPFDVSIISPPPTYLGRFQLDPRTHCGDVVEHDGHQFVVKRVRMQYKYSGGGYRMFRKTIEVKSLARKALESYLERVLNES